MEEWNIGITECWKIGVLDKKRENELKWDETLEKGKD